ncbi:aspartate aminotransferase family protein [Vreelandella venusta]|uniref:Aspartate aminotransferase family protein n=1 Tax=Vreelandella venusta TaxID=44935 RepID=A0AAP9ZC86_9GAMM|nr:aspartate aminotransferase family protein [Halomonas venusta]MBR9925443.1 aspartate aminotransferase family protein [Gammaproteobacteria bacterium]MDW0358783.1 aspartate aminotransferase family protein [Halomonas venusta]MDX1714371.1 aspartate aminotransferase family protein [Halomonas venusta]QRL02871.1 aspartate aminotransferase family protein [Halomonas venusta]UQI40157.1 aspartate aminotransferase family protein [Halomonas venusta]
MQTQDYQALDRQHHLHPFTDFKSLGEEGSRIITHADGVYIYDSQGNRILDGMAGLWCVNLGYGRQELVDAASEQMQQLPYYNNFFKTTHPPAVKLAAKLSELAPEHINHVFFTGSGSEANDTVLRMVRRYWAIKGKPEKQWVISRENGYHGSTVAGMSLGGMAPMHDQGGPCVPGISHICQPYWFGEGRDMSQEAFGKQCAQALEEQILALGEDKVAAFIAEPVQGAGGAIIPPDSYWPAVKEVLAKYDILLIADEVICGFGRLGEWFGSTHYGLKPDLMPIAKGLSSGYLPIGAVLVGDRVADTLIKDGGEFFHGFTYSGHPVCAAVALKNLELLESERVVEKVRDELGPYLAKRWQELAEHPLVGEARSLGLIGALELVADKRTGERFDKSLSAGNLCRDLCFEHGLVMRSVGDTMVMSPPLIITRDEIDELVSKARLALDKTAEKLAITHPMESA